MKPLYRRFTVSLIAISLFSGLSGCQFFNDPAKEEKEQTIRIADSSGYGEEYLRQQYTDMYEFANPKTKIEYVQTIDDSQYRYNYGYDPGKVEDPLAKLKSVMTGNNPPDLVKVSPEQLANLIEENLATPLDPLAQRDQFDLNAIVPAVREGLKTIGDGKLYALAPMFTSFGLVYNKKIFTDRGVPFPKDGMTWDEIFDLAQRVASGDSKNRIFGLSLGRSGELFYDMNVYLAPLALNMVDDNAEFMTVDSDEWENVWRTLIKLQKDKIISGPIDYSQINYNENPFSGDLFLSGKTAMMIMMNSEVSSILDANRNADKIKGFKPVDWDVVTVPAHADIPAVGPQIYMDGIFAINTKSQNPDGAWDLLKFMNGDQMAKLRSRSTYNMVSRESYIKPLQGGSYNIKAFYTLTPSFELNNERMAQKYPNIYQVYDLGRQKLQFVIEGKKEVRQALKEWQTEGNKMLKDLVKNGSNPAPMIEVEPR